MGRRRGLTSLVALLIALLSGTAGAQPDPGGDPWSRYPEIKQLRKALKPDIGKWENKLAQEDSAGRDTSCAQQALAELKWRLRVNADVNAARA